MSADRGSRLRPSEAATRTRASRRAATFAWSTRAPTFRLVPTIAPSAAPSRTSAFAGSQAAQQSVRSSACATLEMAVDARSAVAGSGIASVTQKAMVRPRTASSRRPAGA